MGDLVLLEVTRNGAVYQQKTATVDTGSFTRMRSPTLWLFLALEKTWRTPLLGLHVCGWRMHPEQP